MNKKTKIARIYCRVSTKEQNLDRQLNLKHWAEQRGFYVAHIYAEKASGRTVARPKLQEMIDDLQDGETVVVGNIDHLSRLPLPKAEALVARIRGKGAKLLFPNVGMTENLYPDGTVKAAVLNAIQNIILAMILKSASDNYELRQQRQAAGFKRARKAGKTVGGRPIPQQRIDAVMHWRNIGFSIAKTAKVVGCSTGTVKRITKMVRDGVYKVSTTEKKSRLPVDYS